MPSALEGVKVWVATPSTRGDFHVATLRSYLDTQAACQQYGLRVEFSFSTGSAVHHARTLLANKFLESDYNRIFWIDSDIVWEPVDFMRVVAHTLKRECVAGVYPRRNDSGGHFMRFASENAEPDADGLVEILGCGLGFACVRREVMQRVIDAAPLRVIAGSPRVPDVFRFDSEKGESRTEDYAFWSDVMKAGFRIYADPSITVGHLGDKVYQCSWSGK